MQAHRPSRRSFLSLSVVAATGPVIAACGSDEETSSPGTTSPEHFPQSVASGDPRANSVVLWTRLQDAASPDQDLALELELATDELFQDRILLGDQRRMPLTAELGRDHCVRVRVDGLTPATTYYYRFRYASPEGVVQSRVGRTRTAPAPDSDVPVRFAVVACQDFNDRYYHAYRHLVARDPDFFVHLGDYVYEATVTVATSERQAIFSEPGLPIGTEDRVAAQSLSNYRELYRTYRTDPDLQLAHERHPMIAVYDDHEFSNDCHGATGTYSDGARDETDLGRRANADQAWFEYMPVDYDEAPARGLSPEAAFPDDLRIYRDFRFGQHLHLVLGDQRRYRSDHLVPEDAHPGAIFLTEAELIEQSGALPTDAVPYVDIETFGDGSYRAALVDGAATLELTPERIQGTLSAAWINSMLETLVAAGATVPAPIDLTDAALPRGYAYHQLMKAREHSSVGARYFVRSGPFDALATRRWLLSDGASETAFGAEQEQWFLETLQASQATWKVWGSQYTFMPRVLDLSAVTAAPPEFRDRFNVTAEDWDGMPNRRRQLLEGMAGVDNVVIMTGDLHAFFAGTPFLTADPGRRVVEFVTGSISSTPWRDEIQRAARELGTDPAIRTLGLLVGELLMNPLANPHLAYQNIAQNGYAMVTVDAAELTTELHQIASAELAAPKDDVEALFSTTSFRVPSGSAELHREGDQGDERWDIETGAWRLA